MTSTKQQLWSSVPKGHNYGVKVSQRLQRRVKEAGKAHVGDFNHTTFLTLTVD
jgi:hypothetical protein